MYGAQSSPPASLMRRLRRLVAVFLNALLVQLSLGGGVEVCTERAAEVDRTATAAAEDAHAAMRMAAPSDEDTESDAPPCDATADHTSCRVHMAAGACASMLTCCAVAPASPAAGARSAEPFRVVGVVPDDAARPASLGTPPDLPPPRA